MKIKIALAIDQDGNYNAVGYNIENREDVAGMLDEMMAMAVDPLGTGEDQYWIELDLPIPQPQKVPRENVKIEKV